MLLLAAGVISALGAALAAVAQRDIKKVLAYSTISQLGLMFAALGAGAWVAAFFHLVPHAAFKALLFLGSGSVIHGTDTQDLHEMGGLRRSMPITFLTWTIGALALAGIPPLAGFFSKDALIEAVWVEGPALAITLLAASTLTAFYMARTTRLAFFGEPAPGLHAHEGPASMTLPLVVLASLAATLGLASGFVFVALGHEPEPLALGMSAVASALAVAGGAAGWVLCAGREGDERLSAALGGVWRLLAAGFRWDAFVDSVVVRPARQACTALWAIGDRFLADGAVEAMPRLFRRIGNRLSSLHTGDAQSYAGAIAIAFVLMLVAAVWLGR
jgi:NADH-quinone oxidoreductase subunit L